MVGIPFPSSKDLQVRISLIAVLISDTVLTNGTLQVELKKKHNNKERSLSAATGAGRVPSGRDWYCQEAFRALNQVPSTNPPILYFLNVHSPSSSRRAQIVPSVVIITADFLLFILSLVFHRHHRHWYSTIIVVVFFSLTGIGSLHSSHSRLWFDIASRLPLP